MRRSAMARRPSSWPERASTRSSGVIWAGCSGGAAFILFCRDNMLCAMLLLDR